MIYILDLPKSSNGHIDDKTMEYLTPEDPKPCRFYLLPKIHKENNLGRPIVSANGHPTEKILEIIDFQLRHSLKTFHHTPKILPTT